MVGARSELKRGSLLISSIKMLKILILLAIFSIAGSEDIYKSIKELPDVNPAGIDNNSRFQVHRKLQEKCANNSDCLSIPYSICSLGKCTCKQNYIISNERCLGLLEEMCKRDDDCGVENSTCNSGFCRCKTNFQSQDVTKCHQVPKLAPEIQKPKLGANCSDDSECPRTSICLGTCQCPETHYAKDNHCYLFSPRLGFPARSSEACRYLKNSVYSSGSCQCASGYIENNGKCVGTIGANCVENSECPRTSICLGTCQCPETHYAKDNHCYGFAPRLGFPAHSSEACRYLKNSVYSSGSCQCASGYIENNGKCVGKIGANCVENSECPRTSICLGTCQCPETHYAKDNHCYGFAPQLGFPAHSSEACRYLKNSVYSSGSCQCASGYIENNGKCVGKVGTNCFRDSECALPSVCSGTCQCPENHFFKNGQCYKYPEKLHSNCSSDDQCKVLFSECSSGQCKCKKGYVEHENKCYGLGSAECNLPKDCAGLIFTCKSRSCTEVISIAEGKLMSSKPGTTAIWQPYLNLWKNPERHDHHLGEPGHHPGPEKAGNLAWVKDFTLDRVILTKSWSPSAYPSYIKIWCRAETSIGEFTSGIIIIPGDGLCKYWKNGTKHSTDDWAVLVDLGPTE